MDRRRIAELRIMLIKSVVGGDLEHENLLTEIRPDIGKLLALADVALRIREVYNRRGELGAMMMLTDTVKSAMRDLEDLEEAARAIP